MVVVGTVVLDVAVVEVVGVVVVSSASPIQATTTMANSTTETDQLGVRMTSPRLAPADLVFSVAAIVVALRQPYSRGRPR
jgi:hypothetical protein